MQGLEHVAKRLLQHLAICTIKAKGDCLATRSVSSRYLAFLNDLV